MSKTPQRKVATTCTSALVLAGLATTSVIVGLPGVASAASTYHVATTGSDSSVGSVSAPFRSVQRAVDAAAAGDTILVHKGTYTGTVTITKSGTSAAPITLQTAGDGPVTLTNSFPARSCAENGPAVDRTVKIKDGADFWTVKGLTINNGVWVSGDNANRFTSWFFDQAPWFMMGHTVGNWQERRAIPGQATPDQAASRSAISYMNSRLGLSGKNALDPSEGVQLIGNTVTGRGIHATLARDGKMIGNTVRDIDCGTGPGVWIVALSSNWQVTDNDVSNVKDTNIHHMQEGIRVSDAASYNTISGNRVHDMPTDGRGFTTDVDASFNTFQGNTATNVYIGYSDEMSGRGNKYLGNTADRVRKYGFGLMSPDWNTLAPSADTSTQDVVMSCNRVTNSPSPQFIAGSSMGGRFDRNSFTGALVAPNLQRYWASAGNLWEGRATSPTKTLQSIASATCG